MKDTKAFYECLGLICSAAIQKRTHSQEEIQLLISNVGNSLLELERDDTKYRLEERKNQNPLDQDF